MNVQIRTEVWVSNATPKEMTKTKNFGDDDDDDDDDDDYYNYDYDVRLGNLASVFQLLTNSSLIMIY
jgi:hypothetical protein